MPDRKSEVYKYSRALFALPLIFLAGCGTPEERAKGYYESALALIAKKDDVGAHAELFKALKYRTDKIEIWRALADIDERAKSQALFQDLRRIVELDPNDLDARLKLARIMVAGGAADAALKVIDAANEEDKPNANLHAIKAIILARTNDPAGAVREAQRSIEIDPNNVDAESILASKKIADGDPIGALSVLDALHPEQKDETRIAMQKIQILAKKGDLAKAEALLREVISKNPGEAS
jgi:Flp pilus assembly protein TadD